MERSITVGVVTVAVGERYRAFLPEWANAISRLERRPNEVTIVTDDLDEATLAAIGVGCRLTVIESEATFEYHPQVLVNEAIDATQTEWICKMDVDDVILPHALTPLDTTEADVLAFGIRYGDQDLIPTGISADRILLRNSNLLFSGSPYRRELWVENRYRDMVFEDWAFWIGCAQQDAVFESSGTVDYVYRVHDQQISRRSDTEYWTEIVRSLP